MRKGMRIIAAFILLFVTIFSDVRIVKAAPNGEADVYKIWAVMTQNSEGEDIPTELEIADSQPAGKILFAKFINEGTYFPDGEDYDIMLLLNNASIDLRGTGVNSIPGKEQWRMAGDSSISYGGLVASTINGLIEEDNAYPSFTGDPSNIGDIMACYGQYPYERDEDEYGNVIRWPKHRKYDVNGNHTVDDGSPLFAGTLTVKENVTLEMKDYPADEGKTNGGIIEASWIDLNGKIQMDEPENEYAPAYIRIYGGGWLHIGDNGSLDVADGTELVLDDNASVSENLADLMFLPDGTKYPWNDDTYTTPTKIRFKYSSDAGKWVYMVPRFTVDYDEWFKYDDKQQKDVQTAFVYADEELINSWHEKTFNLGKEIIFNLTAPSERAGCSPAVCIESDDYWRATWADNDEEKITVSNNSFSFTPPNGDYFTVRVWWSDYDNFWTENDNEFVIETRGNNGSVVANLPGVTVLRTKDEPNQLGGKKQIINKSDLTNVLGNKITFTFTPSTDRMLERADFWLGDGQEEKYSLREDNNDPSRKLINADNGFVETNGSYTYKVDFSKYNPTNHISVDANFEESRFKANKYFVDFDECNEWDDIQQKDIQKAFVKVGGENLQNYRYDENQPLYDYTTGTPITFTLQSPEKRNGCTPIVEIETGIGERYSSKADSGVDANHLLTINNNTFSFTPIDNHGFMIRIWWSDYDWFGPGDNEFIVETNGDGGTVTADLTGVTISSTMNEPNNGSGKKQIISKSDLTDANLLNNKIKFTFTPNTNRRLWNIDLWMDGGEERYCLGLNDPGRQQINEENGFIENNDIYTYTIDVLKYNTNNNRVSVNAWFDDPQNSWIKENKYFVEFDEWQYWDNEQQKDVQHGFVKVGENNLLKHDDKNDETLYAYTKGAPITFTLTAPEERAGETPIVEIETGLGEWYSSKADSGVDSNHLINLANDNTFTFTPKDKYGFRVKVDWSDFDHFWYDENNEFLIRTEYWSQEQGTVTLSKNADSFIQEGNGRTGVKSVYSNSVLDEGEPLKVVITPAEGNHVGSIDFNFDRPGKGNEHYRYVTGTPNPNEQDERYIFDAGTGFSMEGDIIYYTVPNNAKSANINLNVDFRENHDDININPHGRTIQYSLDNGAYFPLPDGNTLKQTVFENADTIQLKIINPDEEVRGLQIILRDDNGDECWMHPFDNDGTYTLKKADMGDNWKGADIDLIDWRTALDGQYMIIWFGPEGEMNANGVDEESVYNLPASGPITFSFNNKVHMVLAEPNWSDRQELTPDSNGVYSYTPDSNKALSFKVYANEEEYIFYEDVNPRGDNQFLIEYEVNVSDYDIPGVGGDASYNVQTVKTGEVSEEITKYDPDFIRNRKRIVLENQVADSINNKLTFTITPNIGCEYDIYEWDQDKTADVKANGNKYELDLSDRDNVPRIMISFYAGNTPLSGTVTIDGTEKYQETLTATVTGEVNQEALKYQWKRGDAVIEGATDATYTTDANDVGKILSCEVTSLLQSGSLSGATSGIIARAEGPAAPEGLSGVAASRAGFTDGKITGTSVLMEYATKTDFSDKVSCPGSETTGLGAGTYYVRMKESGTHLAGNYATVTVLDGPEDITGTVSISGTAKFGETLTASVAGSNATTFNYQWKRGDVVISGATLSTYVLVEEDIDQIITCVVSDAGGNTWGSISGSTPGAIEKADGPVAPTGLEVTAPSRAGYSDGKITNVDTTMEYSTQDTFNSSTACTGTEITGLAAGNYYVRVKATGTTKAGNKVMVTVPDGPADITGTVSISGTTKFGETLTVSVAGSNATTFTYQWKRGDVAISGATSLTYTLGAEDIGKVISCEVFDSADYHKGSISGQSAVISKADGPDAPTGLNGVAASKAGLADGKITGVNTTMEYSTQDTFNSSTPCTGTEITGLKAGTYYVRVKATDTNEAGKKATVIVKDGPADISGTVSISGTTKFGQTLTAKVTGSNASTFNYQWKRGNNNISNATSSTYKLVKEDIGQTITCVVSDKSGVVLGTISGKTSAAIAKADGPAAPTNLKGTACTKKGSADGQITGVSASMEYATKTDFSDKKKCSSSSITGLKAGTYYVRIAETDTAKAGAYVTVTVDDGKEEVPQTQDELVKAFVKRLYQTTLGRSGEGDPGVDFWTENLINGTFTGASAAQNFILSEEFNEKDLSYNEFLDVCYAAFFDRPGDEGGYAYWLDVMYNGGTREYVVACFVDSPEFTGICESYGIVRGDLDKTKGAPTGSQGIEPLKVDSSNVNDAELYKYVEKLYTCILDRPSEPAGCEYWVQAIKEGNGMDAGKAASCFFQSKEYKDKRKTDAEFMVDVYQMFFGREPDQGGYDYWLENLKNESVSRVWLIEEGFGKSPEFKGILKGFGFVINE